MDFIRSLSPAVKLSLLLQALSIPLLLVDGAWPWVLGWLLLNHSVLSIAGTVPRSTLLGPNQTRNPSTKGVTLTFDDGPDPSVTPLVLDILKERSAKATFFLIGERALQHPDLVQRIVSEGHRVENHTQHHSSWFCTYSPGRLRKELKQAQDAIESAGAPIPGRFRAPAGVRSPWLKPVLDELGLSQTAWSRRGFDTSQPDQKKVLRRLITDLGPGEILLLHDGNAGTTKDGKVTVVEVLPALLDELDRLGITTDLL